MGVPNGRVVTQNFGHGNTPCLSTLAVKQVSPDPRLNLPPDLSDYSRLSDQDRDQIAKCTERNQEIQATGSVYTKHCREKEAGGDLLIGCDSGFRD